jgi:DNA polymerase III gamma/tau subunit
VENLTIEERLRFAVSSRSSGLSEGYVWCYDLEVEGTRAFSVNNLLVHNCQALSKAAFQSLLKITEDPPSWVYWMFCTTELGKVPKAIQTRCLKYTLSRVSDADLIDLLESTTEAKDVEPEVVALCAREAEGSPRQALSNLAVCLTARTRKEAYQLLQSAEESKEAVELARLLVQGCKWKQLQDLLNQLSEVSPESVRHVVRAYATKVALGAKTTDDASNAMAILEEFSKPFFASDGMTPLVLACGRLSLR